MNPRPRLTRSIPFWLLVAGSLASVGVGSYVLTNNIGTMVTTLTDGTATGVEVYAGQVWGVLGAILIGAGLIGLALALTLGALRAFAPAPAVEVVEAAAWDEPVEAEAPVAPVAEAPTAQTTVVETAADSEVDEPAVTR
ncbi:dinucleotide-utilizing enzyme [uncultured Microbacterium sp.]|uniref:Dinucleotide-utilizing enzyme n=1 Tax=uncultured Microbacterium sp. TaxID=191216 RepID=A0A1Y5P5I3_9MICO|nr:dinucleotide-utilizing enzyme [uncultured Microbacterium sp.]SBS73935.1 Dinucleotide-utilizing enzyme [uncultured Microbacterium sp.]